MSSFVESDVAGTENQHSPAKNLIELNYGSKSIATEGASVVHAPHSVPEVITPSELSGPPPALTENQPEGDSAAPEAYKIEGAVSSASWTPVAYQPEVAFFPASYTHTPVANQPEGSIFSSPAAPVANQPEVSVFPASEKPVSNQPEWSIGSGSVAPVANQPEIAVFPASDKPVANQPEGSTVSGLTAPVSNQAKYAVFPPVANQPEGSIGSGSAAPVANQPEGDVANLVENRPEGVVFLGSDTPKPESAVSAAEVVNHVAFDNQNSNGNGVSGDSVGGSVLKRKRGRPRKLPLPLFSMPLPTTTQQPSDGLAMGLGPPGSPPKKRRGRPVGSVTKHVAAAANLPAPAVSGAAAGVGFTPHIINVEPQEDVLARLISFAQNNTEAVCVLSATGSISSASLQHGLSSAGIVTYVGTFEILSLSGSFLLSESGGHRSRTGGLSVILSTPDGRILGGAVAGPLLANCTVQVTVGTFMVRDQQQAARQGYNEDFSVIPRYIPSVGGSLATHPTLTESSGGLLSMFNHSAGGCSYANQQNIPNAAWR